MMMGLNKLGTAITVIISLTLAALFLEIVYVLWRRHRFRRRSDVPDLGTHDKHLQLLQFLCCKRKSLVRVEPQEASLPCTTTSSSPPELAEQVIKWQCLYGPSRILFTIKEEEREGFDADTSTTDQCGDTDGNVQEVAVPIELKGTTPFSTPCASPPYFTPSSSPSRELGNANADGDGDGCLIIESSPPDEQEPVTVFFKSEASRLDEKLYPI